ncbi:MAG: hypothetical protein JF606_09195 [Burkholderiales bacterium]|jgi:hypothetical protein|nr:hypothetical protein [Burkholderiales bacterium]
MSPSHSLKLSLLVASMFAISSSFAADAMSKEDYKAAKDKITAEYKDAKKACEPLKGNANDICEKEAKAKEKIALADLDFSRSGKDADRIKAEKMKVEQQYAVAKEKCEDKKGADERACKKEAKAAEVKALSDIKAEKKVAG